MTQLAESRRSSILRTLSRGRQNALNLLFPPVCLFCKAQWVADAREPLLCEDCQRGLVSAGIKMCRRCALPVTDTAGDAADCPRCRQLRLRFDSVLALGVYRGDLRDAIIRMKQSANEALTMAAGQLLARQFGGQLSNENFDLVLPMPIHWSRRFSRGVNVSELLAEPIAACCGLKPRLRALRCCRKTKKQGTLRPSERLTNVRNAFAVSARYDIKGAKVLLVDDVMTTGATANEAARVCRRAGACQVHVVVVARGIGDA